MTAPKYDAQPVPPSIQRTIDKLVKDAVDRLVSERPTTKRYRALIERNWREHLSAPFRRGGGGEDMQVAFNENLAVRYLNRVSQSR